MWFNDLGFSENPFDDSARHKLAGNENIMEDIIYNINAGNIVFIEGKPGSGRTAILKKAIQSFMGFGKVSFVECQKIKDLNIEDVLKGKYNFIERIFSKMPNGMIVLMDDAGELDKKNCERIKYFYDQNYIKSIIFTGESYNKANFTESLKDRVKKVIKLNDLKEYESLDILNSRLNGKQLIPDDVAKEIFERTDGNPKKFLNACEELCKTIAETKEEKVTLEHVNKLLPLDKKRSVEKSTEKSEKKNAGKKKEDGPVKEEKPEDLRVIYEDAAERYY